MENSPRQIFRGKTKLWDNTCGIIMFLQTLTKEKMYGSVCVCVSVKRHRRLEGNEIWDGECVGK